MGLLLMILWKQTTKTTDILFVLSLNLISTELYVLSWSNGHFLGWEKESTTWKVEDGILRIILGKFDNR